MMQIPPHMFFKRTRQLVVVVDHVLQSSAVILPNGAIRDSPSENYQEQAIDEQNEVWRNPLVYKSSDFAIELSFHEPSPVGRVFCLLICKFSLFAQQIPSWGQLGPQTRSDKQKENCPNRY